MTSQPLDRTHAVFNQSVPLENHDLFGSNPALREAVAREGAGWAVTELAARGIELGHAGMLERGQLANRNVPILRAFDRYGHRRDEVEFHPAWHELLSWAKAAGLDSGPWADPKPGAHVARAALFHMYATVDNGTQCPVTMTYGCVPTFRHAPADLAAEWLPRVHSRVYDPRFIPAGAKDGVLLGMGMTEKQGGSDVRANTTRATPAGADGEYTLVGHKWFFSAPMCDAFFVLAQAPGGLTCFLLPRFRPDGTLNDIRIQRLKDKLGDRSNAGSEVEFFGAWAHRVGEEGRGVPIILEMGTYTRLDCAVGTAGIMRHAVAEAVHHACGREAFGHKLVDQPLMQNVLADLALESEAATALALRLARAFDAGDDETESLFRRIVTPATKFWICKRGPALAAEAMEVLGGNGYVEEGMLARIYRQMPLNSIWEGSGNIMCLDVLRAARRHPRSLEVLAAELAAAAGRNRHYDAFVARLTSALLDPERLEERGRRIAQELALALQASLLLRHAPGFVAEAFCQSRLAGDWGQTFGTLPPSTAFADIITRAWPAAAT